MMSQPALTQIGVFACRSPSRGPMRAQTTLKYYITEPAIARADVALDAPVFEPVPVASRKAFQTLRFGHRIRPVYHWAIRIFWPTEWRGARRCPAGARLRA